VALTRPNSGSAERSCETISRRWPAGPLPLKGERQGWFHGAPNGKAPPRGPKSSKQGVELAQAQAPRPKPAGRLLSLRHG
jgi:hypothetical protein